MKQQILEGRKAGATRLILSGGEPLMRLSAWRMRREAVELPEHLQAIEPPPPAPETVPEGELPFFGDEIGYGDALEWRLISGAIAEPGPAAVWTRMRVSLVREEPIAPVEHLLVMSDAASGVFVTAHAISFWPGQVKLCDLTRRQ